MVADTFSGIKPRFSLNLEESRGAFSRDAAVGGQRRPEVERRALRVRTSEDPASDVDNDNGSRQTESDDEIAVARRRRILGGVLLRMPGVAATLCRLLGRRVRVGVRCWSGRCAVRSSGRWRRRHRR